MGMVVELCNAPAASRLAFIHGVVPTSLQPLERTRAPDILSSQQEVLDSIPGIQQLTKAFSSTINVATADRYAANLLAATGLRKNLFALGVVM